MPSLVLDFHLCKDVELNMSTLICSHSCKDVEVLFEDSKEMDYISTGINKSHLFEILQK